MNYERIKELAGETGYATHDLLALSAQNDPFFAGSEGNKELARWFTALWEDFGFAGRGDVHIRRLHYRLVTLNARKADGSLYENLRKDWNILLNASRYARFLGLVDPEDIVDRRAPEPRIYLNRPEEWEAPGVDGFSHSMFLPRIYADLRGELRNSLGPPELWPVGYDYDPFLQPYHLEIWVEKSTMNDVLEPVAERLNTNLVTGVGYMTITSIIALLRRIEASEKPARILYVSDHDPAGKNMPIQVARQVEFWTEKYASGADIRLTPIVLTEEQIDGYDLRGLEAPPEEGEEEGEASLGEGAVELDALEARVPGALAEIVANNIEEFLDQDLEDEYEAAGEEAEQAIADALEEQLGEELAQLRKLRDEAEPIVVRYQERINALAREMRDELEPLGAQLEPVRLAVGEGVAQLDPDLPDLPTPYAEEPEMGRWLFDASRSYQEQLFAYKTPEELAAMQADRAKRLKVCEHCGVSYVAKKGGASTALRLVETRRGGGTSARRSVWPGVMPVKE